MPSRRNSNIPITIVKVLVTLCISCSGDGGGDESMCQRGVPVIVSVEVVMAEVVKVDSQCSILATFTLT